MLIVIKYVVLDGLVLDFQWICMVVGMRCEDDPKMKTAPKMKTTTKIKMTPKMKKPQTMMMTPKMKTTLKMKMKVFVA